MVCELVWLWDLNTEMLSDRYHKSRIDFKTSQDLQHFILHVNHQRMSANIYVPLIVGMYSNSVVQSLNWSVMTPSKSCRV